MPDKTYLVQYNGPKAGSQIVVAATVECITTT
jgi:hypothetical protein